jgi:hypothetical protein
VQPRDWFGAELRARVVADNEDRIDPGWYHPSDLGNACQRFQQFRFVGVIPEGDAAFEMAFSAKVGTFIHEEAQRLMASHERVLRVESPVKADYQLRVRGSLDFEVIDFDDIKSVLDMKTADVLPTSPKPEHVIQLIWYEYLDGLTRGILYYIRRASGKDVRFDFEWREYIKIFEASKSIVEDTTEKTFSLNLAPRTPLTRRWCTTRCPFLRICDAAEKGDPEWQTYAEQTIKLVQEDDRTISGSTVVSISSPTLSLT